MADIPHPDPVEEACRRMENALSDFMFGTGPDARVEALRKSILGDEYQSTENRISGLAAMLDEVE